MKVLLKKYGKGFFPATSEDMDKCSKYNGLVEVTIKDGRNLQFHKKLFALIKFGFENQDEISEPVAYRAILTMRCGFVTEVKTQKGTVYLPESLAFSNMSQARIKEVYDAILTYLMVATDTDEKTILNNLINFM